MNISVIIPVCNGASFVREAVESALIQSETAEVILVEDGSEDGSIEACRAIAEKCVKVRLLQHPDGKNHGAGASRNLGIMNAVCENVAFLDADDLYLPGRFAMVGEILDEMPNIDGVYEAVTTHFLDEELRKRWVEDGADFMVSMSSEVAPDELYETLLSMRQGFFCTPGLVVRKALFDRTGYFDEELLLGEDSLMWLKMSAVGRLVPGSLEEPVASRLIHYRNRSLGFQDYCDARRMGAHALWEWGKGMNFSVGRQGLTLLYGLLPQIARSVGKSSLQRFAICSFAFGSYLIRYPSAALSIPLWKDVGGRFARQIRRSVLLMLYHDPETHQNRVHACCDSSQWPLIRKKLVAQILHANGGPEV